MFIGHFALGFAAKRAAPRLSVAALFAAAQLADLIWPFLLAAGVEQVRIQPGITAFTPLDFISYPYSHSLLALVLWGLLFGGACAVVVRDRRVMLVVAALVVSHWVLDWITHRPDMPLYPGGPKYGLGLWNKVAATMVVEGMMFAAGVWIYVRSTRPRDAIGRWGFVGLIALLVVVYVANATGSPPPSVTAIIVLATIGAAIMTAWSWWADWHRDGILTPSRSAGL